MRHGEAISRARLRPVPPSFLMVGFVGVDLGSHSIQLLEINLIPFDVLLEALFIT